MFIFFEKIRLIFRYGPELEAMLKAKHFNAQQAKIKRAKTHLNLCLDHQQEANHSHYSPDNCDHCKLLKELGDVVARNLENIPPLCDIPQSCR